jgi:hypothetical protein
MIAQGFGFTRDFLKERNTSAYFRLKKIPGEFKEQARARHPGERCGLSLYSHRCDPFMKAGGGNPAKLENRVESQDSSV